MIVLTYVKIKFRFVVLMQVDVQEMLKRGWITEQEFKNYG